MAPTRHDALAGERGRLTLLALANFVIGFGAFVVVGVLPPMATDLSITEATAGQAMTVYALGYAIGSPLGVALTGRLPRRTVLVAGLLVFGAGAGLAAVVPDFTLLLAARALMALGGGLVTPVAAAVALGLVGEAERGRALALVFGGMTLAQAIGVPVGAWVGYALGWRTVFVVVATLALASALLMRLRLPHRLEAPIVGLKQLGAVLARPDLLAAVSFTVLFIGGLYVVYTFLAAFIELRLDFGRSGVSLMLFVFGLGAFFGNVIGGRLNDRIGPVRTLLLLGLLQIFIMPIMTLAPLGALALGALIGVWSLTTWSFMVPQQARLAAIDPALTPVLFALNAAAIYVGASVGSAAGGAVLSASGYDWLGTVGLLGIFLALLSIPLAARLSRQTPKSA